MKKVILLFSSLVMMALLPSTKGLAVTQEATEEPPVGAEIVERRTATMMEKDLASARETWIGEARTERERKKRAASDFLKYRDSDGRYADFHATRHTFISNLTRVGTMPKMAQILARHSDINLTMGAYTHVALFDQAAAISALPAPPGGCGEQAKAAG